MKRLEAQEVSINSNIKMLTTIVYLNLKIGFRPLEIKL